MWTSPLLKNVWFTWTSPSKFITHDGSFEIEVAINVPSELKSNCVELKTNKPVSNTIHCHLLNFSIKIFQNSIFIFGWERMFHQTEDS
jgi:hypothetical protein